jgi:ADP-ribose pyrophosphatase
MKSPRTRRAKTKRPTKPKRTARADGWPRIRARHTRTLSPWVSIVAREVEFTRGAPSEIYHAVEQADYISIVALTPAGKIPIVRQYRPALETFSWELPAGLVDAGEDPAEGCKRELLEETGLPARAIHRLGQNSPCTGRLSNRVHSFFVDTGNPVAGFAPEPGITVKLVSPAEIVRMIRSGEFVAQLHVGALLLAELHGFITLPKPARRMFQKSGPRFSE